MDQEAKIYAISSVNGNVMYHVSKQSPKHRSKMTFGGRTRRLSRSSTLSLNSIIFEGPFASEEETEPYNLLLMRDMPHPFVTNQHAQKEGSFFDETGSMRSSIDGRSSKDREIAGTGLREKEDVERETCAESRERAATISVFRREENGSSQRGADLKRKSASYFDVSSNGESRVKGQSSSQPEPSEFDQSSMQSGESGKISNGLLESGEHDTRFLTENEAVHLFVRGIIDDIINKVVPQDDDSVFCQEETSEVKVQEERMRETKSNVSATVLPPAIDQLVHPLHTHLLLYRQIYDAPRCLYGFLTLHELIVVNPRLAVCALTTTSISDSLTAPNMTMMKHLARHRRALFGNNFHGELQSDAVSSFRNHRYLEIVVSLCLYFMRSYYPNLALCHVVGEDIFANKEVQLMAAEVLNILLSELVVLVRDGGKGFASYIADLLGKCKVQKTVLHCVMSSVYNTRLREHDTAETASPSLTETILNFNTDDAGTESLTDSYLIALLKILASLIKLEAQIETWKMDGVSDAEKTRVKFEPKVSISGMKYIATEPVAKQQLFLSAVLSALRQQHNTHMHRHWVSMVMAALPYMSKATATVVVPTANQICRNLELISNFYCGKTDSIR